MEITKKTIEDVAKTLRESALEAFYSTPNYKYVEKKFRAYVKSVTGNTLNKAHIVNGMTELRAISTDFTIFDGSFVLCIKQDYKANEILKGEKITGKLKEEMDAADGLDQCFIAIFENLDFAMIAPPAEHHVIPRSPGSDSLMLHNDSGPAILYPDGSCRYALRDIKVDKKWIETPVEELDVKEALAIVNVDERAEVLNHIGLHRVTDDAKVIAELTKDDNPHGPYRLLDLNHIFEGEEAKHLEMVCPSTNKIHVEGVPNDITSIAAAISWRANRDNWVPSILDGVVNEDGDKNQRQQGDAHLEYLSELPEGGVLRKDRQLQDENTEIRHTIAAGDVYDYDGYQCIVTTIEVPITHPEHNITNTFSGVTKIWNGREVDHVHNIVRDLID